MSDHSLTAHRNDNGRWFMTCSCGRWKSNTFLSRADAVSAGEVHVFRGDSHLRALAQFNRGRERVDLKSELKWYQEQAENMLNSEKDREMWAMLAEDLERRVGSPPTEDDQPGLF